MDNIKAFIKDALSLAALWGILDLIAFVFVQLTMGGAVLETAKWCLLAYALIMGVMLLGVAFQHLLGDFPEWEEEQKGKK